MTYLHQYCFAVLPKCSRSGYHDCKLARELPGQENDGRAKSIDPNNADAYSNRGSLYLMTSRFPQAIADLDQAIKLDPNNTDASSTAA